VPAKLFVKLLGLEIKKETTNRLERDEHTYTEYSCIAQQTCRIQAFG
jgi:hypothetical protein